MQLNTITFDKNWKKYTVFIKSCNNLKKSLFVLNATESVDCSLFF